jgi:hypothetical protein
MSIEGKLEQTVVHVQGKGRGTGFFIGKDGTLLTCYHVVGDKDSGELADKLVVTFDGKEYLAECIKTSHNRQKLDVAVLQLTAGELPPGAQLLPLGKWKEGTGSNRAFRTFGFRTAKKFKGLHANGEIQGRTSTTDDIDLLQLTSEAVGAEQVRRGMSGAPVVQESAGQIVGLVALRFKEIGETVPCAIPIEEVAEVWLPLRSRLRETDLLQQLREKVLTIGENAWFTRRTFKSFYETLPLPGLRRYDELGEEKPEALVEQMVGRGLVYDFINCLRFKRPDIPLTQLIDLPPVHRVNFVNREEELKDACGRYPLPYILFDAPAGYGKTELLKAIEQRHFRDGWPSIYVETPQGTNTAIGLADYLAKQMGYYDSLSHLPDIRAMGYALAGFLRKRLDSLDIPGLILLIDSAERLSHKEVDAFVNHFLDAVEDVLRGVQLRVHIAGRYIGSSWEKRARRFTFSVRPLAPFRFKYVKESVRLLMPCQENIDLYAAYLMYVTGGHPGCMARIIETTGNVRSVKDYFETNREGHREIVLAVAHEIRDSIPKPLREAFDVLSIFRRYNYRLLGQIIDAGLIAHRGDADGLEKDLTATYLVKREGGFIQDEIVRRLLAHRLCWEEPKRFVDLCEAAKLIYEQDLERAVSRPEFIVIEGLYQELQLGYYCRDGSSAARAAFRNEFFAEDGILRRYLRRLSARPNAVDAIADLKTLLNSGAEDWEFRFSINFLLRDREYNNEPYEELLAHIEDFFD